MKRATLDRIEGDWALLLTEDHDQVDIPATWLPEGVAEGAQLTIEVHAPSGIGVLRPGDLAPRSGQYAQRAPDGTQGPERTVTAGEPLPPAPHGWTYVLVDATDHATPEDDDGPEPAA